MLTTFWIVLWAMYGLCIGSFLNVVALRVPLRQSIVHPPSHCMQCEKRVKLYDLVPVFSYLWLRGRCRYCKTKISPMYAIIEAITSVLFAYMAWQVGISAELAASLLLISILITVTITDIHGRIIPNPIIGWAIFLGVIARIFSHPLPWWNYLLAAIICSALLLILAIASNGGMGGGDIKLYFFIGLMLGIVNALLSLFIASLLGLIYGLLMICLKPTFRDHRTVPFAPFIAAGALLAYLYGSQGMDAVLHLIGLT